MDAAPQRSGPHFKMTLILFPRMPLRLVRTCEYLFSESRRWSTVPNRVSMTLDSVDSERPFLFFLRFSLGEMARLPAAWGICPDL